MRMIKKYIYLFCFFLKDLRPDLTMMHMDHRWDQHHQTPVIQGQVLNNYFQIYLFQ